MPTALITGANRGIGLELCTELKARGYEVIATCRSSSTGLDALDVRVIAGVDVTDWDSLLRLGAALEGGGIDLLVCNAGILVRDELEALDGADTSALEDQFRVNAIGTLLTVQALRANLRDGAKVALITSRMGSITDNDSGGYYGYRMSKAALNAAGVSLAHDLRDAGITVVLLHPGWVATDMGGGRAPEQPADSARRLADRIEAVGPADSGSFLHAEGQRLPW